MKPHSRGSTTSSSHHHHHQHSSGGSASKYQFTSTSWKELKYFQIFNLHQDDQFQGLMTTYYGLIMASIIDDQRSDDASKGDSIHQFSKEEMLLNEKINCCIDSKYDLRIFANSLVSYEEVKEAYSNLSDPLKRKYYWMKGASLSENSGATCTLSPNPLSSSPMACILSEQVKITTAPSIPLAAASSTNISQSPVSLFSLLSGGAGTSSGGVVPATSTSSSSKSMMMPYLSNTGKPPDQCTQPTVDQVIAAKGATKTTQLLLNWKCNSNVQEYSLMMKSPNQTQYTVIYRGHNNFYTTPALETGVYHLKVRATNRFGIGEFSEELEYHIKSSEEQSSAGPGLSSKKLGPQNASANVAATASTTTNPTSAPKQTNDDQKIKQREEALNEASQYLSQIGKVIANSISMNQAEEILAQLVFYQGKLAKLPSVSSAETVQHQGEVLAKLESTMTNVKEILNSFKTIREWRILLKNYLSEFIHNSSSNDNEQLEKIDHLLRLLSKDIPEPIKNIIFQTIIQYSKKKVTENSNIRSRTAILLAIFTRNIEFFGENWCNEMDVLSKQLFESKKKKKPTSSGGTVQNSNSVGGGSSGGGSSGGSSGGTTSKKPKSTSPSTNLPKLQTKLQINTTPQMTMSQLQQQKQQKQQKQEEEEQQQRKQQQQQQDEEQQEQIPNNLSSISANHNNNNVVYSQSKSNNIFIPPPPQNTSNYQIDNSFTKSANIPIGGRSIKCSNDEIIHDFNKVPSSPPIGSKLVVSPPKYNNDYFNHLAFKNINNTQNDQNSNNNSFYSFQGFLTPILSSLHQNVNLSHDNSPIQSPKRAPPPPTLPSFRPTSPTSSSSTTTTNVFHSFNFTPQSPAQQPPTSQSSLFYNPPFKPTTSNQYDNSFFNQDDYYRNLMDMNMITTSTTTTTTTHTMIGKQSPPPVQPIQQSQMPPSAGPSTQITTDHSFSFYHIVPNHNLSSDGLQF